MFCEDSFCVFSVWVLYTCIDSVWSCAMCWAGRHAMIEWLMSHSHAQHNRKFFNSNPVLQNCTTDIISVIFNLSHPSSTPFSMVLADLRVIFLDRQTPCGAQLVALFPFSRNLSDHKMTSLLVIFCSHDKQDFILMPAICFMVTRFFT